MYILGGFGGYAREIALALRLTDESSATSECLPSLNEITDYQGWQCLHNGLDEAENQRLAETDDAEEAMRLVLQGIGRVVAQG